MVGSVRYSINLIYFILHNTKYSVYIAFLKELRALQTYRDVAHDFAIVIVIVHSFVPREDTGV